MAATDLGKVGIVMKGAWSSSPTYEALDAVSYNGGLYIAKQAVPANTAPTNTTYWQSAIDLASANVSYTKNADNVSSLSGEIRKSGDIVTINANLTLNGAVNGSGSVLITVAALGIPGNTRDLFGYATYNNNPGVYRFSIEDNGEIIARIGGGNLTGSVFLNTAYTI